jgi:3-dehydroquinate dehydratase II
MSRVVVLNGVNLGLLGDRRPEIYGGASLGDVERALREHFPNVELEFFQTDVEGELVRRVHAAADAGGLVINPGAWTHYSYALHDALEYLSVPKVEVHLSNVHRREGWRRHSVVSPVVDAVVAGMGPFGYRVAVEYVLESGGFGSGSDLR